jgi:hypothetical protein
MVFAFLALGGSSEANDDTPNKNRFPLHSLLKGVQQWMACSTEPTISSKAGEPDDIAGVT